MTSQHNLVGAHLEERYEVVRQIDEGGMGVVYEASDPVLGESVAIKVYNVPSGVSEQEIAKRFENEIKNASRNHQNIVPVKNAGFDQKRRVVYFVMQLIDGPNLAELIEDAPLDEDRALRIFGGVGRAISHLHGIEPPLFHRDIKPQNVLISNVDKPDEHPWLTDFGIAKKADAPRT